MKINQKPDPAKVSHTAVFCARSLAKNSDVPYAKEIWQMLREYDADVVKDGNSWLNNLFRNFVMSLPRMRGMEAILEGRYMAVNNVLENEGNPHVVELASGLSPRGLDSTKKDPNQIYIETDLPGLQKIKREIVEQIRRNEGLEGLASTPNYHLIPLDVVDRNQFMEVIKPYADSLGDKPLAIVHTGLWMYLDPDEQKMARDNIAEVLRTYSPKGMWATPDMVTDFRKIAKNPFIRFLIKRIEKKTSRRFTFYENDEDAKAFLAEGGFDTKIVPSAYLAESLTSVDNLELGIGKVRQGSKMYDVRVMKLAA